jgi:transposase InsO family protein
MHRHEIALSMDGKGCWRDDVFIECFWRTLKYEEVYRRAYDTASAARASIGRYLAFSLVLTNPPITVSKLGKMTIRRHARAKYPHDKNRGLRRRVIDGVLPVDESSISSSQGADVEPDLRIFSKL